MSNCNKLLVQPAVAVVHHHKLAYSETFIRAHIEKLSTRVEAIQYISRSFPIYQQNEKSLIKFDLRSRLQRLYQRKILGKSAEYFQTKSLIDFLLNKKIKVVLAEYGLAGICIMDACQQANIPFVVHFHGYDAYESKVITRFGEAYKSMMKKASAIIAVSQDMERQLIKLGASKDKLICNPYGVDTSLFSPVDISASGPHFVSVGRFVDKKAPYLTLLAFQKVVQACPEAKLIMIGDGYLLEACKQLAKVMKIADNVDFMGSLPHQEIIKILKNARAFLQHSVRTSYGDSEGTPVAVLEAGATGLPVIATKHAGIPDAVIPHQTGFLVEEGDIDGMAEAIITLAKDVDLANKLGIAARKRISSYYSMERSISNLWNILETTIQKHSNYQLQSS